MYFSITNRFITLLLALALAFSVTFSVAFAQHDDHEHDEAEEMMHDDAMHDETEGDGERIEQLKTLLNLLTQLVALLNDKVEMEAAMEHDHDHSDHDHSHASDGDDDTLAIWIEIHSNRTHAHVDQPGMEVDTFFIDDYTYDQEAEIITAIATETGLSEAEIEAVIVFPSGEVDENGDSIDSDHDHHDGDSHADGDDGEMDLSGIHIMGDGSVMLGNGDVVEDATVTDDGMIMLADGTEVEPAFDLR